MLIFSFVASSLFFSFDWCSFLVLCVCVCVCQKWKVKKTIENDKIPPKISPPFRFLDIRNWLVDTELSFHFQTNAARTAHVNPVTPTNNALPEAVSAKPDIIPTSMVSAPQVYKYISKIKGAGMKMGKGTFSLVKVWVGGKDLFHRWNIPYVWAGLSLKEQYSERFWNPP